MSTAPAPSHLLVVDDDPDIGLLLERYFGTQGFRVSLAGSGAAMRAALAAANVDLVLLDLGLPGEDGLELMRELRAGHGCGVIILTGRGDSVDRVVGLELGADDYVAKPFDLRELLARVRSVLRRLTRPAPVAGGSSAASAAWLFDRFRLDRAARRLSNESGQEIPLTTGEYELLGVFLEHAGRVLSRDLLMDRLHGRDSAPFDRSIDVQVGRLRRKIEADPAAPALIKSVRGAGYLFTPSVRKG